MEENPESNVKENRDKVVPVNLENTTLHKGQSLEQIPSTEETENVIGNQKEVITLQVDQSKYQQGHLAQNDTKPSDKEVVISLRNSLKSTPHSVVNKSASENIENKGSGWKVWLPILCVVTIFFLVVIVVSFRNSPEPEEGVTMKSINGRLFRIRSSTSMVHQKRTSPKRPYFKFDFDTLKENMDALFLIVMGCIVFFMQCGFALLEAGSVRSKNTVNILTKNMVDVLISGVSFWAVGWGFSYGRSTNGLLGVSEFFGIGMDSNLYPLWFFQYGFAATAATIVSGAVAERVDFFAYFVFSIFVTAFVYPTVVHWGWNSGEQGCYSNPDDPSTLKLVECNLDAITIVKEENRTFGCYNCSFHGTGWLKDLGYNDYAGSGIVHLLGGTCALIGCYIIGPRKGRFKTDLEDGRLKIGPEEGNPKKIPGHSVPLAALGGFILMFGFLAFNGGSQLHISSEGDAAAVGIAVVNTIIGGCGGGMTVLFSFKYIFKNHWDNDGKGKWSFLLTLNGVLTGMVSICAGCDEYAPLGALIVGSFGGITFVGIHILMERCKIDDPLDSVAVHGGGGLIGVLMVPFFSMVNDGTEGKTKGGVFLYGDHPHVWKRVGVNLIGALVIITWSLLWSVLIFKVLKYLKLLRISEKTEEEGNDIVKHGESAYPMDSWAKLIENIFMKP